MKHLVRSLCAGLLATGFVATAAAVPLPPASIEGRNLIAGGNTINAAFLFADAVDTDELRNVSPGGSTLLFNNRTSPQGATSTISGLTPGQNLTFRLNDLSTGSVFDTGLGSTNAAYLQTSNAADITSSLGITLSGAGLAAFNALAALGPVAVIGFEDRPLAASDRDYNDLLFAFSSLSVSTGTGTGTDAGTGPGTDGGTVPVPGSVALLGAGGLALGLGGRRRRNGPRQAEATRLGSQ